MQREKSRNAIEKVWACTQKNKNTHAHVLQGSLRNHEEEETNKDHE